MSKTFPSCGDSGELPTIIPLVTLHMVRSRTVELPIRAGRSAIEIRQSDYERAKRELAGEKDADRQQAVLHLGKCEPMQSGGIQPTSPLELVSLNITHHHIKI